MVVDDDRRRLVYLLQTTVLEEVQGTHASAHLIGSVTLYKIVVIKSFHESFLTFNYSTFSVNVVSLSSHSHLRF